MKADCKDTGRLIERLECMAQSFEKMSPCPDHDAAKWYRKAIDALEAKDKEIERLEAALQTIVNREYKYSTDEMELGYPYADTLETAKQALGERDD